jgi:hypothetical protein
MIFFLLKRDPIFKARLALTLVTPLVLIWGRDASISVVNAIFFLAYLSWFCLLLPRASHFEVSLPIAGQQFLFARVLSTVVAVWLPVGACLALLRSQKGFGQPVVITLLEGAAAVTMAAMLPLSARIQEAAVPIRVSLSLWVGTTVVAVAGFLLLPPLVGLMGFAMASVAVFLRAWSTVPKALQLAPPASTEPRTITARQRAYRPAWWLMWRSAFPWFWLFLFPAGIFAGIVSMFGWTLLATIVILAFVSRQGTRWLQSLPVSRRALLTLTLAATVVPFMAGAAAGMAIVPSLPLPFFGGMVGFGPRLYRGMHLDFPNTNVPLELWRLAPRGNVPAIQAPWGEAVQPVPLRILGLTFYNPYDSGKSNSRRFFEWQFARATEALHGRPISQAEYQDVIVSDTVRQLPHAIDQPRIDILALAGYLFGCLFAVFLHEVALSHSLHRATRLPGHRLAIFAPFVTPFLVDEYYLYRHSTTVSSPLARMVLLQVSAMLPQNLPAVAAIAVVPSIAMYFLLQWQFAQSEITNPILPNLERFSTGRAS